MYDDVQIQFGVRLESGHIMRKRSIDQPLRIHLVYDVSLHALPHDKQQLVKVCVTFYIYTDLWFLFHMWQALQVCFHRNSSCQQCYRDYCEIGSSVRDASELSSS